ncbi:MAG: hypothetical protein BWY82_01775 [Verrucomicrobia bacterium ADurb.Bin474]|nr:MAG: hypothetical protein BWY82_01775 [Verrucomicrobia bacterium ADurb.Bin474]
MVFPPKLPLEFALPILIEFRFIQNPVDILIQRRIFQMQLRCPVLVEQRNRRPIFHRLLEIVDGYVISKDLPGSFLARDQRSPGERQKHRLGECGPHVQRQRIILAPVGFIGQNDDVPPVAQHIGFLKLMDQCKHVAVIAPQQILQVRTAGSVAVVSLLLTHGTHRLEGLGDLLIQLRPVSDDHKCPVTGELPQDLLGEKHHGETLAAALGLPKHTAPAMAKLSGLQHRADGAIDPDELVVLPDDLHQPLLVSRKERKVLNEIQQSGLVAGPPNHHLQRHTPRFLLSFDPLPFKKPLPVGGQGTNPAVGSI